MRYESRRYDESTGTDAHILCHLNWSGAMRWLAATAGVQVKQNPDDLQEVQNYIKALDYGLER